MDEHYFESFDLGDEIETSRRYISESDLRRFLDLVGLREPLFDSKAFVEEESPYDGWIVPGYLTMCYSLGLFMRTGWLGHGVAFLGAQDLSFDSPVYVGDEIQSTVTVVNTRRASSGDHGIVKFEWDTCTNDETVMTMISDHLITSHET